MLTTFDKRVVRQPRSAELQLGLRRAFEAVTAHRTGEDDDPSETPAPVPPERRQLADAGILHLSPIVQQLVELWNGPESDDYGRLRPTKYAFDRTVSLLVDAAIVGYFEQRQVPFGCVSTDSDGDVRIEWVRDRASVHLIVPATNHGEPYIYHEVGGDYATEDATPERLSYWLRKIA